MKEILYDENTKMSHNYPRIRKLGAINPHGEMTPFVWKGVLHRLELVDPGCGTNTSIKMQAGIRNCETGEFLSYFADDSYFHAGFLDGDTFYVTGVDMSSRDTIRIYETKDLIHWTNRVLLKNPGWVYYNTGLTKGPDGYVILMEASHPVEIVGEKFTHFFAKSKDLITWEHQDYDKCCFTKSRYVGGPWLKYSEGWYYITVCEWLPGRRFTNYIYRSKDLENWYSGYYNPILMSDADDKIISPNATSDLTDEIKEKIITCFNSNNSDLDMCDYNGKVYMNYLVSNQYNFYYMCEAEYDGTLADFLKSYFE